MTEISAIITNCAVGELNPLMRRHQVSSSHYTTVSWWNTGDLSCEASDISEQIYQLMFTWSTKQYKSNQAENDIGQLGTLSVIQVWDFTQFPFMYAAITSCHAVIVVDLTCLVNHPIGEMGAVPIDDASKLISQLIWPVPNCDMWCHFGLTGAFTFSFLVFKLDGHERRGVILVDFEDLVHLHLSTGSAWLYRYKVV